MITELILPLDAFVRTVRVNRGTPHALLLGAGASISSGMPSAQMCIWDWKREIFLTNNLGLEGQFSELSLNSVRRRIQGWLDRQGLYPNEGSPDEYSVYIEACFPIADSRRAFFAEKIRNAHPHVGYQLLALLAEANLVKSVWTPNFDGLTAKAAAAFNLTPVEAGIDSQDRVIRTANRGELLIIALHGDYRYDQLKNTAAELREQESVLEAALVNEFKSSPVIVCGYSGRDRSLMSAMSLAMSAKGAGSLYWCVQNVDDVPGEVIDLISLAREHNRPAFIVPTQGFDDLLVRLSLHTLDEHRREKATAIIAANSGGSELPRRKFHVDDGPVTAVLKSNAFEVDCPAEVYAFELHSWPASSVWRWVKEQTAGKPIVAVPFKGRILALATIDDLASCFGNNIKGLIQRCPVSDLDFRYEDGAVVSLMKEALVRAIAISTEVATDNELQIWFPEIHKRGHHNSVEYVAHESVSLFLRFLNGRAYLVLKPSLQVLSPTGEMLDRETTSAVKLSILGWQHNREFNEAMNRWRSRLLAADSSQKALEYPPACGSTFRFLIRKSPAFAQISAKGERQALELEPKFRSLLKQKGIVIEEPRLLFTNKQGNGSTRDVHPIRGIVNNRPFDHALTVQGFGTSLRLGIVCPRAESGFLRTFLQQHRSRIEPTKSESDYLYPFQGFQNAFGIDFDVPEPNSPGWITCGEPSSGRDDAAKSVEIAQNINRAIESLQATYAPHVVLILFPERWFKFRGFKTPNEHFDVHDFVKAQSVQRGVGTQFLDQSTLNDPMRCRVWWWLSLAFYVKSMRTPWVLDGFDSDTAFVGLGLSQNSRDTQDKKVVLGCSHIYSSRGEGLQYRLSQVENPVFYGRNPFLSRDDARRVGEQIRELFFDSRERLPSRVVIHKRTHFTADERLGLREGLSGVPEIEMLEITIDPALRYVASSLDSKGSLSGDNYPVRRGTVVKVDDFTALVWVHGVTSAINSSRRYYQGKRRIPAPLVIRRHAGNSDLRLVAEEILGLSKMNWNTFDLYTKLPATVQSSNEIARIGSLIERVGMRSYDFRLFI